MTDKKEIIVHGVDVSECEKLAPYNGYDEETKCNPSCCQNSPNCKFKQLKRKERECEELKQWKEDAENLFKTQTDNADKIINRYKQALDEIKEIACEQRIFDLTGKIPLLPVIEKVGKDFLKIQEFILKAEGSGENGNT